MSSDGATQDWCGRVCAYFRSYPAQHPLRSCWRLICTQAISFTRSGSRGSSSIQSRLSGIRLTMRLSICSVVRRDCTRTRTGPCAASRTCLASITSAFNCGRSPALRRNRVMIGRTKGPWLWREQSLRSSFGHSVDVQAGQRLAARGMAVQHCGHSLVDAAGGGGAGIRRFTCLTIRKITKATIRNAITELMKMP